MAHPRRVFALAACLGALGLGATAGAETPPAPAEDGEAAAPSLTDVNKQLTNPVSELWSITFQQNNFRLHPGPGEDDRWSSNLLFQPVLPVGISPDWNLVTRPVIPLFVSQPHPDPDDPGGIDRSVAFGDVTFLQLVSPSPKLAGNWLLGVGPSWIFPTAGSDFTGQGKFQVGPGGIVGYLSDKWIAGALIQNWWSYGGSGPMATSSMNLQPIVSYFLPDGWSVGYSGNILANWKADGGNVWTVPIGVSVSKVLKLGKLPIRLAVAGQYMPVHPEDYGQRWNLQIIVAPVLPKLVKGYLTDPRHLRFGLRQ